MQKGRPRDACMSWHREQLPIEQHSLKNAIYLRKRASHNGATLQYESVGIKVAMKFRGLCHLSYIGFGNFIEEVVRLAELFFPKGFSYPATVVGNRRLSYRL